jgi:hypothetical protein
LRVRVVGRFIVLRLYTTEVWRRAICSSFEFERYIKNAERGGKR